MSFPGVDQQIRCKGCNNEFTFTAGEQEWYTEHNLHEAPKRCRQCRDLKKRQNAPQSTQPQPAPSVQTKPFVITDMRDFSRPEQVEKPRKKRWETRHRRDDEDSDW